jgi:predicted acylesterase/phospholipase RssA
MLDKVTAEHSASAQERAAREKTPAQKSRQVVLVFQGGGALDAYQAGVYQALHEAKVEPDWIIGTSIGAINASLIAGNEPEEPETIWEVLHRHKDIQYSSRVASHIARQRRVRRLRHVVSELVKLMPESERNNPAVRDLAEYGCLTRMHVVRLLAPRLDNENHTKDIDFSPTGIRLRWDAGYTDTMRALKRAPWNDDCDPLEGVILHEPAHEPAET